MIVGAGYTGLWTAYALQAARSALRVADLRSESAGSARRAATVGGAPRSSRSERRRREATVATRRSRCNERCSARSTRSDVSRTRRASIVTSPRAGRSGGDVPVHRGAAASGARDHRRGGSAMTTTWLGPTEAQAPIGCRRTSAPSTRRTARRSIPRGSCGGSRAAVERSGVPIYEHRRSRARRAPSVPRAGRCAADVVVRATEAFTPNCRGQTAVVPIYSLMIATEPLLHSSGRAPVSPNGRRSPTGASW